MKLEKSDIKSGTEISCRIDGELCNHAIIQVEHEKVYVCQNVCNGDECDNRLGKHFSWSVGMLFDLWDTTVEKFFKRTDVTNIEPYNRPEWDEVNND